MSTKIAVWSQIFSKIRQEKKKSSKLSHETKAFDYIHSHLNITLAHFIPFNLFLGCVTLPQNNINELDHKKMEPLLQPPK